jgi:molybdopterin/thiamine biosynthesis adenylyltransferase
MRIVIIGLGGVGGWVLRILAPYLWCEAGNTSRRYVLCIDGDTFEHKNRARMLYQEEGPKALVLTNEMNRMFESRVTFDPEHVYVTAENISKYIREGDIVFCCPDNHKTRKLVEDHCKTLENVALFSGGNDGTNDASAGTYGNVQVFIRSGGKNTTNPLSQYHPEIAEPVDKLPHEMSCEELAQSAPQLVFTNAAVATSLTAAFYAWGQGALSWEEAYLDIQEGRVLPVARQVAE